MFCSNCKLQIKTLELLKCGARERSTGSTNMNASSSRSHAIFTIQIKQDRYVALASESDALGELMLREGGGGGSEDVQLETFVSKFHFVDLAGSERLKRTGSTGHRAKEGICINRGLVSLLFLLLLLLLL
jgi:kinesin family member 21